MATKNKIIIIPGIGDRRWYYELFATKWRALGFKVAIYVFDWNDKTAPFNEKQKRFLEYIDAQQQDISIIGISAGGSAAVNGLAARLARVQSVITVASPLASLRGLDHPLLKESIRQTEVALRSLDKDTLKRILSVYGEYDQTVPIAKSKNERINEAQIPFRGHGKIIFIAMLRYSHKLQKFLLTLHNGKYKL